MSALYLHGMGHFHPENVITNRFLEEMDIGTSETWIMERVGIHDTPHRAPFGLHKRDKKQGPESSLRGRSL